MECQVCKEIVTLAHDNNNVKLCESHTSKYMPDENDKTCVTNYVIFHVFLNMKRLCAKSITSSVVSIYSVQDIVLAKEYLLKSVSEALKIVDPGVFTEVKTSRRNTENHTKAYAIVEDILKVLTVLDTLILI